VIAGGGVAALEAALALRALAAERVRLTLLTPSSEFSYRPLAVLEPFAPRVPRRLELAAVAADLGVTLVRDAVAAVDCDQRLVYSTGQREISYDALMIAVGASTVALPGALTVDIAHMHRSVIGLVEEIERGVLRTLAFVVPLPTWPVGAYELALLAREHANEHHKELAITVVTAEQRPLAVFGEEVSTTMVEILADAQITTMTATEVHSAGSAFVTDPDAGPLRFDRVVAFPKLTGPAIDGLPADADGFLPTSSSGEVIGVEHVYAAGDATDFPVKYGGVAAGQADAAAASIAAAAGVSVPPALFDGVVHGFLLRGRMKPRQYFSVRIRTWGAHGVRVAEPAEWAPGAKLAARHLGPYVDKRWPSLTGLSSPRGASEGGA
jgi:sulfide:quinone oxidoreductase